MALVMASELAAELLRMIEENGDMPIIAENDWSNITSIKVVDTGEHVVDNEEPWMVLESTE